MTENNDTTSSVHSEFDAGQSSSSSSSASNNKDKLQDLQISLDEACNMIILMQEEESQRQFYFEKLAKLNHDLHQALELISSSSSFSPLKSISNATDEALDSVSYRNQHIGVNGNGQQALDNQNVDNHDDDADLNSHNENVDDDEENNGDMLIGKLSSTIHQAINALSNIHNQNITLRNEKLSQQSTKQELETQLSTVKEILLELKLKDFCWSNLVQDLEKAQQQQQQQSQIQKAQSQSLFSITTSTVISMVLLPVHISLSLLDYSISCEYPGTTKPLITHSATNTGQIRIEVAKVLTTAATSTSTDSNTVSSILNSSFVLPLIATGKEVTNDTDTDRHRYDQDIKMVDAQITALIKIYHQKDDHERTLNGDSARNNITIADEKQENSIMMIVPNPTNNILYKLYQLTLHTLSPRRLIALLIELLQKVGDKLLRVIINCLERLQKRITPYNNNSSKNTGSLSTLVSLQ